MSMSLLSYYGICSKLDQSYKSNRTIATNVAELRIRKEKCVKDTNEYWQRARKS